MASQVWANSNSLSFSLVPTKSIQAGQTALLILPVRILENSCRYDIKTKGTPDYPVQAPTELAQEDGEQTIVYLPFSVQIPASAPSGQLYTLRVSFYPQKGCEQKDPIHHDLFVNIQSFENVSIEGGPEKITQTNTAGQVDLALKNTGNTALNLNLHIESFTPSVRIEVRPSQVNVAPGELKKVKIYIDFSASGADFASFKVQALSGGQKFLSKNYQIRLLRSGNETNDGRRLQSQFYLTNDFFSESGSSRRYNTAGASLNGDLSDYYALSTYLQSSYLQGEEETFQYELDLTKNQDFRVTLGSSLNPTESSTPGVRQLNGFRASKSFFEALNVGMYGGVDQQGNDHVGGFVDYNQGYKNRYLVFWDKNLSTGFEGAGLTAQDTIRVNSRLAIAPSLVLARDELRGNYSRIGTSLNALMTKYAPLQVEMYREEDNRYVTERMMAQVIIPYKKVSGQIGATQDDIRSKGGSFDSIEGIYREAFVKILFPISKNTHGQVQLRYQTIPDGTSAAAPEILLTHSSSKWQGMLKVGQQLNRNSQNALYGIDQGLNSTGKAQTEQYAQLDLQYRPSTKYNLYLNSDYYRETDTNYYRYQYSAGGQYNINETSFVRAGIRTNYQYSFFNKTETNSIDVQYSRKIGRNVDLSAYASYSKTRGIDQADSQVGVRLSWTPSVPVSRKVENAFGGRSTAQIQGKVCFDMNQDSLCGSSDKPIKGAEVRLEGLSVITDEDGNYQFRNLQPGRKEIAINPTTLPSEVNLDKATAYYDLRANDEIIKDFAFEWRGTLRVIVFEDKNKDGKWQNDSEMQLPDVEVELSGNQVKTSALSSSFKPIIFNKLKKGTYIVKISKPLPGSTPTYEHGLKVNLPNETGEWLYLGLNFDDAQDENEFSVITTQSDNIIYTDNMKASFLIEDPEKIIRTIKLHCGDNTIESTYPGTSSHELKVDLAPCKPFVRDGVLKLDMEILTRGGASLEQRNFEFLVY
ncbi:hypothetical protein ACJVC5_08225 [Peredibacter sp. HCB2-198]|uniref:hypothetical protein n=1 Tax=Peredibacter sp. HCB2-198 TaxID=3383025 RepID=UPI0038B47004